MPWSLARLKLPGKPHHGQLARGRKPERTSPPAAALQIQRCKFLGARRKAFHGPLCSELLGDELGQHAPHPLWAEAALGTKFPPVLPGCLRPPCEQSFPDTQSLHGGAERAFLGFMIDSNTRVPTSIKNQNSGWDYGRTFCCTKGFTITPTGFPVIIKLHLAPLVSRVLRVSLPPAGVTPEK